MREHGHVCQGGTPAQRLAERRRRQAPQFMQDELQDQRLRQTEPYTEAEIARSQARIADVLGIENETAQQMAAGRQTGNIAPAAPVAPPARAPAGPVKRRWHTEDGDDGEPRDVLDAVAPRKPALYYAPAGKCVFCDRRRAAARKSMRSVRERGEA